MRRAALVVLLVASPLFAQQPGAPELVRGALQAMGGEARFRSLHAVRLKGIGQRPAIEQSERPEGPWFLEYAQIDELRDFDGDRLREDSEVRGYSTEWWHSAAWSRSALIVEGGSAFDVSDPQHPAVSSMRGVQPAEESLAFGPERLLLHALEAADLTREADQVLHGFPQHVVRFTWKGTGVRVWLSPTTSYPAVVELTRVRPYDVFWSPWGDVTTRITWSLWTLEPNGLHYPRQWTFESNGLPERTLTIHEIGWNVPRGAEVFPDLSALREEAQKRRRRIEDLPLGRPNEPPHDLAPGIVQIAGAWNITEVRQPDGVVILEGPIANVYSAKVLDDAKSRFPGLPVKAVITTSDSWPHIGGLREYFARGIDVYALDLNVPILQRLAAAPHRIQPDALQKAPAPARLRAVGARRTLGTGATRMELIPLRTVTGERQLIVWFPESHLLYTSDLFARQPDGTWWLPQYLSELESVVEREKLEPVTIFGMHYGPVPYTELLEALKKSVPER